MTFQDQTVKCADCNSDFVFTVGEQEFFQQKGFSSPPKRCPDCRAKKRAEKSGGSGGGQRSRRPGGGGGGAGGDRPKFPAVCSRCGAAFDAPFAPKPDRPIFCRDCFQSNKR